MHHICLTLSGCSSNFLTTIHILTKILAMKVSIRESPAQASGIKEKRSLTYRAKVNAKIEMINTRRRIHVREPEKQKLTVGERMKISFSIYRSSTIDLAVNGMWRYARRRRKKRVWQGLRFTSGSSIDNMTRCPRVSRISQRFAMEIIQICSSLRMLNQVRLEKWLQSSKSSKSKECVMLTRLSSVEIWGGNEGNEGNEEPEWSLKKKSR